MHFNSIRIAGLLGALFATPAWSQAVTPLNAVQFTGAPALTPQVFTETCSGTQGNMYITCATNTYILPGQTVADTTTSDTGYIPLQTLVTTVSGATVTITTAVAHTFTNDTIEFIGQQINDQLGQSFSLGATAYNASNWELSAGTSAPGGGANLWGPMLKISKYESVPQSFGTSPGQCKAQVDPQCNAALYIGVRANADDHMESQGMYLEMQGNAPDNNCEGSPGPNGNCNISGLQMRIQNSTVATNPPLQQSPSGGLWKIIDQSPGINSGLKGLEIDLDENSGQACNQLDGMKFGACNGLILVANGTTPPATVTAALHVRGVLPAAFIDGLGFDQTCCINSDITDWSSATNGILIQGTHPTAAINDTSSSATSILIQGTHGAAFDDSSSSINSILIQGSHSVAALNVASGAGPVILNENKIYFDPIIPGAAFIGGNTSTITLNSGSGLPILEVASTGPIVQNGVLTLSGYTVSTLPPSPLTGSRAYVTDARSCIFGGTLTGGGSMYCPVDYNGTAWTGG